MILSEPQIRKGIISLQRVLRTLKNKLSNLELAKWLAGTSSQAGIKHSIRKARISERTRGRSIKHNISRYPHHKTSLFTRQRFAFPKGFRNCYYYSAGIRNSCGRPAAQEKIKSPLAISPYLSPKLLIMTAKHIDEVPRVCFQCTLPRIHMARIVPSVRNTGLLIPIDVHVSTKFGNDERQIW